jgi:hypothetical protein
MVWARAMARLTRILGSSFLAGATMVLIAGAGSARPVDRGQDDACTAACRRWRECGMPGEQQSCAADCATSSSFEGRGVKQAYGVCLAKLTCGALRESIAMNEGPAGFCRHVLPMSADERDVRNELGIPDGARLISLHADPQRAGTFGREGLRIVAVFDLGAAPEAIAREISVRPGWAPLPISRALRRVDDPPRELPRQRRGAAYCRVGVWREGTEFDARPCGTPGKIDHYRAAVIDVAKSQLTAVFKNYY